MSRCRWLDGEVCSLHSNDEYTEYCGEVPCDDMDDDEQRNENGLKPCPFCGGEANVEQTAYGTTDLSSVRLQFAIRCKKCGATAPNANGYIAINLSSNGELNAWHDDRNPAIAAWNRRANDEQADC